MAAGTAPECVFSDGTAFKDRFYTHENIETSEFLSWVGLTVLFFAIGTSVELGDIIDASRRVRALALGAWFHYFFTPLLAFICGSLFRASQHITKPQVASLLILACTPGSPQSVVLAWHARGDVGLALMLLFSATFLDLALWPALSYGWATLLPGNTTDSGDCYVTLPTLDIVVGHILLLVPLVVGLYARLIKHRSVFYMRSYAHILTSSYFLVILTSRSVEWDLSLAFEHKHSFELVITFVLLNLAAVFTSCYFLNHKQTKSLLLLTTFPSLLCAYPATRLTFRSESAAYPIIGVFFCTWLWYGATFYFSYEHEKGEEVVVKIPKPMLFDKHVAGLFHTVRHLDKFRVVIHDDYRIKGTVDVEDSSNEEYATEEFTTPDAYRSQSEAGSVEQDTQGRRDSLEDEEKFLTASEVKLDLQQQQESPIGLAKPSPVHDLSSIGDSVTPHSSQVELTSLRRPDPQHPVLHQIQQEEELTPRDSPEPHVTSASRRRRLRKKRAQKARKLVRNLSPASDSEEDSGGTGVESNASTNFTTIGASDVASRVVQRGVDRPPTVVRSSRRKKKKKRRHARHRERERDNRTFSATPSLSNASTIPYHNNVPMSQALNVPVYTSSYVGSDMMMNSPYHGEGMSLVSTHYSHNPVVTTEPGAAAPTWTAPQGVPYQSYHSVPSVYSASVPSQQTYVYYH